MFSLEWQTLRWLIDELGLVAFSYDHVHVSPFGRAAERLLPRPRPLETAGAALHVAIQPEALLRAHRERRTQAVAFGEGKAYVVPAGEASLLIVHPHEAESMQRAMAAHDTSHALGLVLAWSRLAETGGSGGVKTAMEGIRGAVEAARMALEGMPSSREVTSVREVVDEVLQLLEPLAAQRTLRVDVKVPEGIEVRAPRAVVYRALWNVVENAYTALGVGQSVEVSARRKGERVEIRVADDGPGVPEKLVPTLFTKRPRAGLSRGIGLSGVAESLAAVGGAIRLDTAHRPGACFVIELPHEAKVERNRSGVRKLDFAPRVLVVEDDAALRDLLVATFELEGIVVEARRDSLPDEIQRFDAALVDLRLDGEGDGLSLAEELRNRGFAGPIHLMSGGEPPHETWSEGLHFHRKPFDPTAVAAAVAHSIRPVVAASMGA